jgi:cytochrome d ubiquinol oxidase subunit II
VSAELADRFRARALATALVVGVIAAVGILVLRADAPRLFDGLLHRGLPLMVVSALAGLASILLLVRRRYGWARITGALAVTAVLWGWAVAQYPYILPPYMTITQAVAGPATQTAMLVSLLIGSVLLLPALVFLYLLFQRSHRRTTV